MKLLFPLCVVGVALGPRFINSLSFEPQDRIVGGSETSITDFPFMAAITLKNGKIACGGSIISENYILTAADCVYDLWDVAYTVRVGSTERDNGGTVLEVKKAIIHPKHDESEYFDYDIALLELKEPIEISPTSQPVKLPEEGRPVEVGEVGVVAGWGLLTDRGEMPTKLHQASVTVSETENCNSTYAGIVTPRMFCTEVGEGGSEPCEGDFGDPLLINDTQIGIALFGSGCTRHPWAYTNVPVLRSWISEIAGV